MGRKAKGNSQQGRLTIVGNNFNCIATRSPNFISTIISQQNNYLISARFYLHNKGAPTIGWGAAIRFAAELR